VASLGVSALVLAALALVWPQLIALPFAVLATWLAAGLLARARALQRERKARGLGPTQVGRRPQESEEEVRPQ
jgi:hypothetical protein